MSSLPRCDRSPSLVVLTRSGREHRYVTNVLNAALPIHAVVVDVGRNSPNWRRKLRGGPVRTASRASLAAYRWVVKDQAARDHALRCVLGDEATSGIIADAGVVEVDGLNTVDAAEKISALAPDALLVYGTSIVADHILTLARDIALNLHTGISPYYRGAHCAFWPVVNGEPERIGATVHECTARVDGGKIYSVGPAPWKPDDDLHMLFARAVRHGADLYVATCRQYIAGELAGRPQDLSYGREYKGFERGIGAEMVARRRLRSGLLAAAG